MNWEMLNTCSVIRCMSTDNKIAISSSAQQKNDMKSTLFVKNRERSCVPVNGSIIV